MKNNDKTNAMRILERAKIPYESFSYEQDPTMSGTEIAGILHEDVSTVYKTLVTRAKSGQHYVFVIPVASELDLKKAAKAAGEKSISMLKQKELLPTTGYVHGGCSPLGMKKVFPTFIHSSAKELETFYVSAGKLGRQICLSPEDLKQALDFTYADVTTD